jgi:hypothetical protein
LDVNDIPYDPPREAGEDSPADRLTLHHFTAQLGPLLARFAPNNSDARQPQDISAWPPAIIIDIIYASAVLRAWGPKAFKESLWEKAKTFYYNNQGDNSGMLDDDALGGGPGISNTSTDVTVIAQDYLEERTFLGN